MILSSGDIRFVAAAATDVGLVREGNEDSYFAGTTVFAVADGMGGHVAGEIASSKALEPIAALDGSTFPNAEDARDSLVFAITSANTEVIAQGDADPALSGMGTTLTAVIVREGRLHLAHVGDSRAYLLRSGQRLRQLTTDHTLVAQLVREGRISPEQAATHPQRSVITRAIGVDRDVDVDVFPPLELEAGDQILLCSDGLTGPVSDERISAILSEVRDADEACTELIEAAKAGGAPDNVTVVLLRVEDDPSKPPPTHPPVDDVTSTGPLPGPAPLRTSDGARAIRTRSEDPDAPWAERMGRYGETQGADHLAPSHRPRRGRRVLAVLLGVLLLAGLAGGGAYMLLSRTYFVGDDEGQVAIFNGTPQSLFGLPLYWVSESTDLPVEDLPPRSAERVAEGLTASSLTDAREIVERYRDIIAEEASPSPSPSPSPTASSRRSPSTGASPGADLSPAADATAEPGATSSPDVEPAP